MKTNVLRTLLAGLSLLICAPTARGAELPEHEKTLR